MTDQQNGRLGKLLFSTGVRNFDDVELLEQVAIFVKER